MIVRLGIDVPLDTIRGLICLDMPNLPSCVAIDQARVMYPWVDQLFGLLRSKVDILSSEHQKKWDQSIQLELDVPLEMVRELMRLERIDLPSCVAIDQARVMYPWVNVLFKELCNKASTFMNKYHMRVMYHSLFHDDVDRIFDEASVGVFMQESES